MEKDADLIELERRLQSVTARDMMSRSVVAVTEEMHFAELATIMLEKRISGVPVVRGNKVVGVITVTDLLEAMFLVKKGVVVKNGKRAIFNPKVVLFMTGKVVSIGEGATLEEIMEIMKNRHIHTLPVMDGDRLLGVVGRRDVFKNFYRILHELCGR